MKNPFYIDPVEKLFDEAATELKAYLQANANLQNVPNASILALPKMVALKNGGYDAANDNVQAELKERILK